MGQFLGIKTKFDFEKLDAGNYILKDVDSDSVILIYKP
jgi:hypothetical protein